MSARAPFATRALFVAGLFVLALGIRLLALHQLQSWPLVDSLDFIADTRYYDMQARAVANGDLLGDHAFFLSPGYSYFLGAVYALLGPGARSAQLAQCLLGAATCLLLYGIGRRAFSESVGRIAGVGLALYGFAAYQNLVLLPGTLVLFLNLLALLALVGLEARPGLGRSLGAGVLVGLAAFAKGNAVLLVPAASAVLLWLHRERPWGRRLAWCGALALGCLLVLVPVTLRNHAVSGEWVLLTTNGGRNLLKGNGPGATGTHRLFEPGTEGIGLHHYLAGDVDHALAVADSRRLASEAWRAMAQDPAAAAGLFARKLGLFFHARELGILDQFYFVQGYAPILGFLLRFGWVAPLGLLGLVTALASKRGGMAAAVLGSQVFTFTLLFVLGRYRLVAAACLILFASHQLRWSWDRLAERAWSRLWVSAGALVVLALAVNRPLPEFPTDRGFGEQHSAIGRFHLERREHRPALRAFRNAGRAHWVSAERRHYNTYMVGLCQALLGRTDRAQATLSSLAAQLRTDPEAKDGRALVETEALLRRLGAPRELNPSTGVP